MRQCSFTLVRNKTVSSPDSKTVLCGFCLAEAVGAVLYPSSFNIAYLYIDLLITVIQPFTKKRLVFLRKIIALRHSISKLKPSNSLISCLAAFSGWLVRSLPNVILVEYHSLICICTRIRVEWSSHVLSTASKCMVLISTFCCHSAACALLWLPPLFMLHIVLWLERLSFQHGSGAQTFMPENHWYHLHNTVPGILAWSPRSLWFILDQC